VFLYVQPALFDPPEGHAVIGELTVALVGGTWSVGGTIRSLSTLEPLALTALPGQQDAQGRETAGEFLAELLDVLAELHEPGPFGATSASSDAG